jgi:predicted permease
MIVLHRAVSILRWLLRRDRAEQELHDELQAFIDLAADDKVRGGLSPSDARRMAAIDLGGLEPVKERVRSARHGAWIDDLARDLRYGVRQMRRNPAFSLTVIGTLALGIGVNTALFNLWHGTLHAPLPGIERPETLVMLTDRQATGSMVGRDDGPRKWVSYAEFERLRQHASAFSGLMASQSGLDAWGVTVDGGVPEKATGRLVSGTFFDVLGVRPALGRLFGNLEDSGEPASAVISHSYWRRRFNSRPDAIGRTLIVRDTPVTIVGVTPPEFVGETGGQQPDMWLPLRLQPRVLPGTDWLRERPPDKVMWLHVFGRVKSGLTNAQADTQANAIFLAGLEEFYGPARREEAAGQRLRVQPAGRGASGYRGDVASSLTVLLASAGVLLLIACINLANLLVVRGSARQIEIAVRMSLGASRRRVVRQLVTENVVLAALGGVAALLSARLVHDALVMLLRDVDPRFFIAFSFTPPVLAFLGAATLAAALVSGILPAWHVTKRDPGSDLTAGGRGSIGSRGELRAGHWLAGLQLSLTFPLLLGAGLLVRTVDNLQHPVLGFDARHLLLADVQVGALVQDPSRRDRALRELHARILRIPGVEAASFSQLGLFTGGFSTATIEVPGAGPSGGGESALDRVGSNYFATLRVPILRGRDIAETDRADTHTVCIVNEAFARRYFAGRDPVGMRVTTDDYGVRTSYEVVGLARDARTRSIRDDVEPRFFVPAEQRPSRGVSRTFLIRTAGGERVVPAVRAAMEGIDAGLSASDIDFTPLDARVSLAIADDRTVARLALVFGAAALTLAAMGLYGVLSYAVRRRTNEFAVRIALGARSNSIIGMVLRRTAGLVLAGLLTGGVLAYVVARAIASRLYGVAPQDPATMLLATGVLLLIAFVASYVPARRAARIDPLRALHGG